MSAVNNGPQIIKNGLVFNVDAAYMRSYSPNVYPNPTDLLGWQYMLAGNSCTLSRDTTISRQYGSIPMKMTVTGSDSYTGHNNAIYNLSSAVSGQTWTLSVYVKASVSTFCELFIFGADINGNVFQAGSADYGGTGALTIGTSWQRISYSFSFSNANVRYIQIRLDGSNSLDGFI